jgi:hypothetical protein
MHIAYNIIFKILIPVFSKWSEISVSVHTKDSTGASNNSNNNNNNNNNNCLGKAWLLYLFSLQYSETVSVLFEFNTNFKKNFDPTFKKFHDLISSIFVDRMV